MPFKSENFRRILLAAGYLTAAAAVTTVPAGACSRAEYHGKDGLMITGRTMDWKEPIPASLWILPRGLHYNGGAGRHSVSWQSKYGSIVVTSFGISAVDGMNERGLTANMLWLAGSEYPAPKHPERTLSIAAWAQYFLDNFATVDEAVKAMRAQPLQGISYVIPGTDR